MKTIISIAFLEIALIAICKLVAPEYRSAWAAIGLIFSIGVLVVVTLKWINWNVTRLDANTRPTVESITGSGQRILTDRLPIEDIRLWTSNTVVCSNCGKPLKHSISGGAGELILNVEPCSCKISPPPPQKEISGPSRDPDYILW